MPVCLSHFTYLLGPKMACNCMLLLSQPGVHDCPIAVAQPA